MEVGAEVSIWVEMDALSCAIESKWNLRSVGVLSVGESDSNPIRARLVGEEECGGEKHIRGHRCSAKTGTWVKDESRI